MEIGSFIELQFMKGKEYYRGVRNVARLNTGRAGIWCAFELTKCDAIWIPYYQCDSVLNFFNSKGVKVRHYQIDEFFNPINLKPGNNEAVLLVNYFGIMSNNRMLELSSSYKHVIIDNSQAFFAKPLEKVYNVYSCRKFIGVPDGAYLLGKDADTCESSFGQSHSSDTSLFLLERIEYGCEGKAYKSKCQNEERIEKEDCLRMSTLTRAILDGTDYNTIIQKRCDNFSIARGLFDDINAIDVSRYIDEECVPMVYPLLIEDIDVIDALIEAKHFQGHWWTYLTRIMNTDSFEYSLSKYMVPITIDQRYSEAELRYIKQVIETALMGGF